MFPAGREVSFTHGEAEKHDDDDDDAPPPPSLPTHRSEARRAAAAATFAPLFNGPLPWLNRRPELASDWPT